MQAILERKEKTLTIPISKTNNVATFQLAAGYNDYLAFCTRAGIKPKAEIQQPLEAFPSLVNDDEDSDQHTIPDQHWEDSWEEPEHPLYNKHTEFNINGANTSKLDMPKILTDEEDRELTDASLMLRYHQAFGHAPFERIREIAKAGGIPKRLATCKTPCCSACMYAKASKRPWRGKTATNRKLVIKPKSPGD